MGRSVRLWKTEESKTSATYLYGPDQDHVGELTINKADGTVSSKPVASMPESDSWFYYGVLATEAAQRLWRSGSYPSEALLSL